VSTLLYTDSQETASLGHGPPPGWVGKTQMLSSVAPAAPVSLFEDGRIDGEYYWYCSDNAECPGTVYVGKHHINHRDAKTILAGANAGVAAAAATYAAAASVFGPEGSIAGAIVGYIVGVTGGAATTYSMETEGDKCIPECDPSVPPVVHDVLWCAAGC